MKSTPYETPKANLVSPESIEVPNDILKKIKGGWIVALISGVMTIALIGIAMGTGALGNLFDWWSSLDVVLIFALAFGIYKKSRTAATIMFVYFLLSKIWFIVETGKPSGIVLSLVFLYFYLQAMIGTYQYHKFVKEAAQGGQDPQAEQQEESGSRDQGGV